jgi:hypothetical protein
MLCEHYEKKVVEATQIHQLDLPQIGNPKTIVSQYYQEKLDALDTPQRQTARTLIEDGLVSKGEDGMRLSLHESFIEQEYQVNAPLLERLVNSRLLRSEPFLRGGYTYELSHDRLLPAVIAAREARQAEEAELARQAEAERLRAEAEVERLEKEKAKRQLRLVRGLLGLAVVALLVAGYFAWNANQRTKEAIKAQQLANQSLITAYQADLKRLSVEIRTANRNLASFELYQAGDDVKNVERVKIDSLNRVIDTLQVQIEQLKE